MHDCYAYMYVDWCFYDLQREDKETTEDCVSIPIIIHSAIMPEFYIHPITHIQFKYSRVTAAVGAIGRAVIICWNLTVAIFHQDGPHHVGIVAISAEGKEIETLQWCSEDS